MFLVLMFWLMKVKKNKIKKIARHLSDEEKIEVPIYPDFRNGCDRCFMNYVPAKYNLLSLHKAILFNDLRRL